MANYTGRTLKRREIASEEKELYDLLNLEESNRDKLDGDAIIRAVQQNPLLASHEQEFSSSNEICLPLHQSIRLCAPVEVVNALWSPKSLEGNLMTGKILHYALRHGASFAVVSLLLEKHPRAVKEVNHRSETPLSRASHHHAPLEVVSLLFDHWPGAIKKKDRFGWTPLFVACFTEAPLEVVSFLLDHWPDAAKEKDRTNMTPLILAFQRGFRVEVVSLLLKHQPEAVREKDLNGNLLLHLAVCYENVSLGVILLLLDMYPEAAAVQNFFHDRPSSIALESDAPADVYSVLLHVSVLLRDNISKERLEVALIFFIRIQWWNGILMAFSRHPVLAHAAFDLDTSAKADYLSKIVRSCKLTFMWEVIRNEQDLLADA